MGYVDESSSSLGEGERIFMVFCKVLLDGYISGFLVCGILGGIMSWIW